MNGSINIFFELFLVLIVLLCHIKTDYLLHDFLTYMEMMHKDNINTEKLLTKVNSKNCLSD